MLKLGSRNTAQEWLLNKRYQVVRVLSSVGWGKTYVAIDMHRKDRPECVVKYLKPVSDDPDCLRAARTLFEQEAKILETLKDCDFVPQLLDYREVNRAFYLVQEFVAGQPLSAELIPRKPWSEGRVIALLQEVLEILALVHDRGIIHSDLRPEKLIYATARDGGLVLTGFNILNQARSQLAAVREKIGATVALGTLGYMSVEQVRGKPLPSSDLYSLGMISISALTGLDPVQLEEDRHSGEIIWRHRANVNNFLAQLISRMVCYHVRDRYSSAHEVLSDLYTAIAQFPEMLAVSEFDSNGSAPVESSNGQAFPIALATDREDRSSKEIAARISDGGDNSADPSLETPSFGATTPTSETTDPSQGIKSVPAIAPTSDTTDIRDRGYPLAASASSAVTPNPENLAADRSPHQSAVADSKEDGITPPAPEEAVEECYFSGLKATGIVTFVALVVGTSGYFLLRSPLVLRWAEGWFDQGDNLFAQAEQKYQAGELLEAEQLVKAIAPNSIAYSEAQSAMQEWRKEWKTAQNQYEAVKQAARENKWSDVLEQAKRMPKIAFWQQKIGATVKQAQANVEREAQQLLEQAYEQAIARKFGRAIDTLKQIPAGTQAAALVPDKIAEYREKETVRANYFLQQAYNSAQERNFNEALEHLAQIPPNTVAYARAREKKAEYQQKREIKANYFLQRAYNRALVQDFAGALTYLQQIPKGTLAHAKAQAKIVEYATQQNLENESASSSASARETSSDQPFSQEPFVRPQTNQQGRSEKAAPLSNLPLPFPFKFNPGGNLQEINTP